MDQDQLRFKGKIITDQVAENITRVEELAYELKVEEVMTRNITILSPDQKMREVLEAFRKARISGAPVVKHGELVGIVSIEDLIHSMEDNDLDGPVEKYMTSQILTIRENDPVVEALKIFVNLRFGRLPVLNADGRLVGIITKGDVTRGVLKGLEQDYQVEELKRYRAKHLFEDIESDRTSLILRYNIRQGDFTHGGAASSHIKRALIRLGASPVIARRIGIAIYEAEMNLIIHTENGGIIRVEIEPHQISIDITDDGPGIKDIELAMKPGYSTATEAVREMGFGAGMGLVNIARCVDFMKLESTLGKGTRLKIKVFLKEDDKFSESNPTNKETTS
ncbi:MAG: CBS domain-containing protein [Anaerolineaceae bacterium]|nr:CBS domain-containing protein [Anaerolineaceae bacterium]